MGAVVLRLPDYPDRSAGDCVYYYWLKEVPDDPTHVKLAGKAEVTAADQVLPVPESFIKEEGDGEFVAIYALTDKAGNISRLSLPASVSVALGAMPANLQAPVVPLAADGLIDRADAMLGVQVHIPEFTNWKPTDEISASWQGAPSVSARSAKARHSRWCSVCRRGSCALPTAHRPKATRTCSCTTTCCAGARSGAPRRTR